MAGLLVELRVEELPAPRLRAAAEAFRDGLAAALREEEFLDGAAAASAPPLATSRRLAAFVDGVRARRPDREERLWGPPVKAAFDTEGRPTKAGEGFARTAGVALDAMSRGEKQAGKPPYLYVDRVVPGATLAERLPERLARVLRDLPFRKSMRWPQSDAVFARPVRGLAVLHGDAVVPVTLFGVEAGRIVVGHRFLDPAPRELRHADVAHYVETLRGARVLVDMDARRERVREEVTAARARDGGEGVLAPGEADLLDEVTGLVEWPAALTGSFDDRYLALPEPVLVTAMARHLRMFPVRDAVGALRAAFVSVTDRDASSSERIRGGNERVLRARLYDADFFFHRDRRAPLESFRARLDGVDYHRGLGTLREKSDRVGAVVEALLGLPGAPTAAAASARRAAYLLKCDLATEVVQEFPELQGVVGAAYARAGGEPESVALALEAQYQPREEWHPTLDDDAAALVSLAEKADALAAYFSIGEEPTGSADPYGLRRHALGLLRILAGRRWPFSVEDVLGAAGRVRGVDGERQGRLHAFVWARAEQEARNHGYVDFVAAVGALTDRPYHAFRERLEALRRLSGEDGWRDLLAVVERTGNMGAPGDRRGAELPVEAGAVAAALERLRGEAGDLDPETFGRRFGERLAGPVAALFDAVLVDDPAAPGRSAALKALLFEVFDLFRGRLGDLRRLGGAARPPRR